MATPARDFHDYLPSSGTELRIKVERGTTADDPFETTFSMRAVESLAEQMQAWVISRLIRGATLLKAVPDKMHISVHLTTHVTTGLDEHLTDLDFNWVSDARAKADSSTNMFSPESMDRMREVILAWLRDRIATLATLRNGDQPMPQYMELTINATIPDS